jgi:hypothetical protein
MNTNSKKPYLAPALREGSLSLEYSFLTSGTGENANPEDGYWEN